MDKPLNNSELFLIDVLQEYNVTLNRNEIADFGLQGDETSLQVREYASDYVSELDSENAQARQERKDPNFGLD